jgi:hypothetical protein
VVEDRLRTLVDGFAETDRFAIDELALELLDPHRLGVVFADVRAMGAEVDQEEALAESDDAGRVRAIRGP